MIYVLGSINTDFVITAPRMPQAGETLTGGGFFTAHGGKGANQAVAAARLGGKVAMCACVGDDSFGQAAVEALQKDGIDTTRVRVQQGVSTGTAVIVVTNGDNRIILDKGANEYLTEKDVDDALENATEKDVLLLQLEIPLKIVRYALKKGKEKGMFVLLNPAPACKDAQELLPYCDLLIPNETETEILGGKQRILEQTQGNLIVTLGGKGFELTQNNVSETYPCLKVHAVDTTAAGDTFCGGLAVRISEGAPLAEAAKFGSNAASLACTKKGAQPSIPTRKELEEFLAKRSV